MTGSGLKSEETRVKKNGGKGKKARRWKQNPKREGKKRGKPPQGRAI